MESTVHGVAKSWTWLSDFHLFHFIKGCCDRLQGIFPTQRSNPRLLHWQAGSLSPAPSGKPIIKDTDEKRDEQIHRMKCERIQSIGVAIELGCVTLVLRVCVCMLGSLLNPPIFFVFCIQFHHIDEFVINSICNPYPSLENGD